MSVQAPWESPEAAHELLTATRAAMRALPALYVGVGRQEVDEAEVAAAEIFCLLGLYAATTSNWERPTYEETVTFVRRVLESLLEATPRPRSSPATMAAFCVRHGVVNGGAQPLTERTIYYAGEALSKLDAELARTSLKQAERERMLASEGGVHRLAGSQLWPTKQAVRVEELLIRERVARDRLRAWYGMIMWGSERLVADVGNILADVIAEVGPPAAEPGERAVYISGEALMRRTSPSMRAMAPPPAEQQQQGQQQEMAPPPQMAGANEGGGMAAAMPAGPANTVPDMAVGASFRVEREPPVLYRAMLRQSERVVNTGFARINTPETPLMPDQPLRHSERALFWLEVGELIAGSIEKEHTPLPVEKLPPEAELTVALFGFNDGLIIHGAAGAIKLQRDGRVIVTRQPGPMTIRGGEELLNRRLFFPLAMPKTGEEVRLRCNIYCKQVLVQSRLVVAKLNDEAATVDGALTSTLDYNLSRSLRTGMLEDIGEHRLSVMLNDGTNGTHQFRFFGKDAKEFVNDASFLEGELSDLLRQGREALRAVSWGATTEWKNERYRYEGSRVITLNQLEDDLKKLAVNGYRFYDMLVKRLSGGQAEELEELMRRPGRVQFTARRSAKELIPAALIYDRSLYTQGQLKLCPAFRSALEEGRPLELEPCFQGDCPSASDIEIVCPSGFWGFRHDLGIPVSLATDDGMPDAAMTIQAGQAAGMAMCVSTDPGFVRRQSHQVQLKPLFQDWAFADSVPDVQKLLAQTSSHVIYFYCHGGLQGTIPYIMVGNGPGITRDNFRVFKWKWNQRPLVFINGCHTSALEPSHAFDLVTGFIETANAAGVVGTEVSIFEPLACEFAETFMELFVKERKELGAAVRLARLRLLQKKNPLGLVYIPFGLASLRLT